jgi:hypothetical protein
MQDNPNREVVDKRPVGVELQAALNGRLMKLGHRMKIYENGKYTHHPIRQNKRSSGF